MFYLSKDISQILKIGAALLVVTTHYIRAKALAGHELNWIEWIVRSQGHVAVAVFFFLSGYGLMSSELSRHLTLPQFVGRRFLKIYLPVVAVTALWLPVLSGINGSPMDVFGILWLLLWDFADPVMWFVKNLLVLYAGFGIFARFLHLGKRKEAFAVLCLTLVATALQSYLCNGMIWLNSLSGIPLFVVGIVAALYPDRFYRGFHVAFAPLVLGFVALVVVLAFYPRFLPNTVHAASDCLCVGVILVVFSRYRPTMAVAPVLSFLSLLTFDLYLLHFKTLTLIIGNGGDISLFVYLAATLTVTLLFGLMRIRVTGLIGHRRKKPGFENISG